MAGKRKPAIEGKTTGIGSIGDELVKAIGVAFGGGKGAAKRAQAERIMKRATKKEGYGYLGGPPQNKAQQNISKIYRIGSKVEGQKARAKTYRRKMGYK